LYYRGEISIGNLTALRFEGLSNPLAIVKAIHVKWAGAFIRAYVAATWAEIWAPREVSPEGVKFGFSFHVFNLPRAVVSQFAPLPEARRP